MKGMKYIAEAATNIGREGDDIDFGKNDDEQHGEEELNHHEGNASGMAAMTLGPSKCAIRIFLTAGRAFRPRLRGAGDSKCGYTDPSMQQGGLRSMWPGLHYDCARLIPGSAISVRLFWSRPITPVRKTNQSKSLMRTLPSRPYCREHQKPNRRLKRTEHVARPKRQWLQ